MLRDTMLHNSNIELGNINKLIHMLGMSNREIECIIKNNAREEIIYLSDGPDREYCSGYYGSTSIRDF